jgi:uncharacterized protein (TIGR02231 family)
MITNLKNKSIFLLLAVFFFAWFNLTLAAQEQSKTIHSSATEVKVFLSGAQVTRTAGFSIEPGVTVLSLEGLSQYINPATIQVSGKGNFIVLDVNHQVNYLKVQEKTREVVILEDSLKVLLEQVEFEKGMLWVSKEEESLLLANKNLGGTQTGVRSIDLKDAADLFRNRLREIKIRQLDLSKKIRLLEESISRLRNQLATLQGKPNPPSSDIFVKVSSSAKVSGTLEVNYFTNGAGWVPVYDLRASKITEPVEVISKASLFQNTGEKWEKVKLAVSSANPVQAGVKPILQPWYLGFYEPVRRELQGKVAGVQIRGVKSVVEDAEIYEEALSMADFTTISETQVSFEFQIDMPYNLPPDNKRYTVDLQKHNFITEFEYHIIPKIDTDAFLMAKITGWENQNLLPGEIQLFFEGTFVGKSYLDPGATSDTLQISLGRDKGISVKRTRLAEFTERKFLGTNRIESRGWEIVVRNNKSMAVKLLIEDQIPVSINKEIEITANEVSGADYNKESGKLLWRIELKPSESKTFRTKYTVKYPRNKTVLLD